MDSGNSSAGSMQSSSGGDDEFDSRPVTISSSFFNPSSSFGGGSVSIRGQRPPPTAPFESLGAFSHSPNEDPNLVWSRGLRSDPNYINLGDLTALSSSSSSLLGFQGLSSSPMSKTTPSVDGKGGKGTPAQGSDQTNVHKNPRKRTRASRRAPTTVLTTDTSNFRQMVQEFTGIPAPPFSASPYSRRLDLLGSPLYSFRSSPAQKVQVHPPVPFLSSSPLLSSTMVDANTTIATPNSDPSGTTFASSSYKLIPPDLGLMQNPVLSFQPLFQSEPGLGSKSQGNSAILPALDELGLNHGHMNPNLGVFQSHGGFKLNSSASGSSSVHFHPEKGSENVFSRNEGAVDSWICPSE